MSAVPKPESQQPYLAVSNIEVIYDHVILVLKGVSLSVPEGKIVALLGANGAGKTTTLKAISNLLRAERGDVTKGTIEFRGRRVDRLSPDELVRLGVVQVMEGRHCFAHLTVEENLLTGAYTRSACRLYLGGRAADDRPWARADGPSEHDPARRAFDGARAADRRGDLRDREEPQSKGEGEFSARGAKHQRRAALRRSRLHPRERPRRHGRRRRRARRERGRQGVPSRHFHGRPQELQSREALPPQEAMAFLTAGSKRFVKRKG